MKKNPPIPISKKDLALFRQEMKTVRPLKVGTADIHHQTSKPAPVLRQRVKDEVNAPIDHLSDHFGCDELEAEEPLFFARPGLQHRQLLKLRKGQLNIDAELDLHGLNSHTARQQLTCFLADCRNRDIRCIRIIHGKGWGSKHNIPILKNRVNAWLQQLDEVLAFCSALAHDGGTGAVYVLLKSNSSPRP